MAKAVDNSVLDAALDKIATATTMTVCSGQPANYAGIAAVALGDAVMSGGDYTNADGDTSGRKVTVGAKTSQAVDTSGTATHVALDDGTTLLFVTTCTSQALTSGNTFDTPAFDIEIADPT